jgi:putative hydrolase of the HAD superfamily
MKAVIFDLFETLVSFSLDEYNQVLASMAERMGKEPDVFVSSWHRSWPSHETGAFRNLADYIFAVAGPVASNSALKEASAMHEVFQKQVLIPDPETVTILKNLKNTGFKIGLITNCPIETPEFWPESPLSALIDIAVFSTVEGIRKPDSVLFTSCCERLGCAPSECFYVGDGSNRELQAASDVGMHAMRLGGKNGDGHEMGTTILNLSELMLQIERIKGPPN